MIRSLSVLRGRDRRGLVMDGGLSVVALALTGSLLAFGPLPASQPAAITVRGTVTAAGHAMAGMKVVIHAWPDQAVVQALKPGQKVPWILVGTAMTGSDGRYSVSLPLAKLMPEASYGVVNLEADTKTAMSGFPVVVKKTAGNSYLVGPDPVVNLAGKPHDNGGCLGTWYYVSSLGKRWATVGETYVPTSHATQHFKYTQGQSSSIGWGSSVTGGYGTYSENGTYSWSINFGESWKTYGAHQSVWYRTQFHWGKYGCRYFSVGYVSYGQHVNGYVGGATHLKPTFVPATPKRFCVRQESGSSPASNNSAAVTWTRGLAVKAVEDDAGLGFDASLETGFDSSAQVQYKVSATRMLCGWKDFPGQTPRQLVIRF